MKYDRPMIGDQLQGGIVHAIGIKQGERWAMTLDKYGGVGLWPEGAWDNWISQEEQEKK